MTTRGIVRNGAIELLDSEPLPEGTVVRIEPLGSPSPDPAIPGRSLAEELGDLVGSIDDLPSDFALNHENYRFGTPKR